MYWTRLQILLHTYFCATCLLFLNSPNACTMYSSLYFASWGVTDQSKERMVKLNKKNNDKNTKQFHARQNIANRNSISNFNFEA